MTIVEFYDNNCIENIVSALLCDPDRVILVGNSKGKLERARKQYQAVADGRGLSVTFSYQSIAPGHLQDIVDRLSAIVETSPEPITFDLTGGEDLYLVAVGMVYKQHPDRVQLHRFNIHREKLVDCDQDGNVLEVKETALTIEENVTIYGGRIVYDLRRPNNTYQWEWDPEFERDIQKMWEIYCSDRLNWNGQLSSLARFNTCLTEDRGLRVSADIQTVHTFGAGTPNRSVFWGNVFANLVKAGLIVDPQINDQGVSFSYKNQQIKKCLTKAGQLLELYVTVAAKQSQEPDGSPVYRDVMCGVVLAWNEEESPGQLYVDNEMDVMLTKGLIPVFVSCKNGDVDSDELYKLSTVAERFGGKYAKKVLIATELGDQTSKERYLIARAKDMGIEVIRGEEIVSPARFQAAIRNLWKNG